MRIDAVMPIGKSTRMRDKPFRLVAGRMLFEYGYSRLLSVFDRVFLVCAPNLAGRLDEYPDVLEEKEEGGPLCAVRTAAERSEADYLFVLACDMPFASKKLIENMALRLGGDGLVPKNAGGGYEPLFAFYRREAILPLSDVRGKPMSYLLERLDLETLPAEDVAAIDPSLDSFENFNTEEDLKRLSELVITRRGRMMC